MNYKSRRNRWSIIKVGETSLKRILNKNFCKILIKAYQVLVQYHKNTFLANKIMFISKVKLIKNINNSLSEKIFVINLDKIANIQNIRQDLFLSRPVHTEVLLTGFWLSKLFYQTIRSKIKHWRHYLSKAQNKTFTSKDWRKY